jgi:hypothetical protein
MQARASSRACLLGLNYMNLPLGYISSMRKDKVSPTGILCWYHNACQVFERIRLPRIDWHFFECLIARLYLLCIPRK